MTSSASRCSSTITARRSIARAPAAPARTSRTRAMSRRASASRIMSSTMSAASRRGSSTVSRRATPIGETPVPCVACNQFIKFADLFETARDLGADVLATGHYVSARDDGTGERALYRARDASRDQSYFLFATTREQLRLLRFPLGDFAKSEVRELARRYGLSVADKPDSQDICFVPSGGYAGVVERLAPQAIVPGEIVHIDGRVLGRHPGVVNYTVGQRRGLGLGSSKAAKQQPLCRDPRRDRAHRRPRAGASSRSCELHGGAEARPWPWRLQSRECERAAFCGADRRPAREGRRGPARGAGDERGEPARRELDRPRRLRGSAARGPQGACAHALDAPAGPRPPRAARREGGGRRLRGGRIWSLPRSGLRVLREWQSPTPACSAAASSRPRSRRRIPPPGERLRRRKTREGAYARYFSRGAPSRPNSAMTRS